LIQFIAHLSYTIFNNKLETTGWEKKKKRMKEFWDRKTCSATMESSQMQDTAGVTD